MSCYEILAGCYDRFTGDVDYNAWADYLCRHFARGKRPVQSVLDLACGTGSLTCELARRGYHMTGVDLSADMLTRAAEKVEELAPRPLLLQMSMDRLALYEPVDACVCCLDSINYVTRPKLLQRTFARVYENLNPGGVFVFDFLTQQRLASMDGQVFLDESEDYYCVWRGEFSRRRRICTYGMDLFYRDGDHWLRDSELHQEFAYTPEELSAYLTQAGFKQVKQYGDRVMRTPTEQDERCFFVARKELSYYG